MAHRTTRVPGSGKGRAPSPSPVSSAATARAYLAHRGRSDEEIADLTRWVRVAVEDGPNYRAMGELALSMGRTSFALETAALSLMRTCRMAQGKVIGAWGTGWDDEHWSRWSAKANEIEQVAKDLRGAAEHWLGSGARDRGRGILVQQPWRLMGKLVLSSARQHGWRKPSPAEMAALEVLGGLSMPATMVGAAAVVDQWKRHRLRVCERDLAFYSKQAEDSRQRPRRARLADPSLEALSDAELEARLVALPETDRARFASGLSTERLVALAKRAEPRGSPRKGKETTGPIKTLPST